MPPRFAFWTILIDNAPTAFRAREKEELLPTLHQLQRTNPTAVMKWFAHGRLWDTPEQAQWAKRNAREAGPKKTRDWRPGGAHKDPRQRFKKQPVRTGGNRRAETTGSRPWRSRPSQGMARGKGRWEDQEVGQKPLEKRRGDREPSPERRGARPLPPNKEARNIPPAAERITGRPKPPKRR
jgi:hypothetical protein